LEDLQDNLAEYQFEFRKLLAAASPGEKIVLAQGERLLEHVLDKVTEACAMV
jgi:hypothetical protein